MARKSLRRPCRNKFYIFTNGKETEVNYFELLKSKKSIYDVKVHFKNSNPLNLAKFAKKEVQDANQVWIVFDIDDTFEEGNLIQALEYAENNGIHYAYSNKAFEVWLISHFSRCNQHLNVSECETILKKYLSEKKCKKDYDKTDKELLKKYFIPNYKIAIRNAEIVYQEKVTDFQNNYGKQERLKIWEWNSSTSVFKLVKALNLKD